MSSIQIQQFTQSDWPSIVNIYQEGIDTGIATFETQIPTWEQWNIAHIMPCRLKATLKNSIVGWTALSAVSNREVYKGVAEVSIYISKKYRNLGIGKLLLSKLIETSEQQGFWTLQAGIFSANKASIALHTSLGFRVIGIREKVGKLNNHWFDNTILERRSNKIM